MKVHVIRFVPSAALALMIGLGAPAAEAQMAPGAISVPESAGLAEVWFHLANGRAAQAASLATRLLDERPQDPAVLSTAVEARMAAAGWQAGLDTYERWLGARTTEERLVVRRIAMVVLRESAADERNPNAQLEALRALARHADTAAIAELSRQATDGGLAQTRALAAVGDPAAVGRLVESLESNAGNPIETIRVLGESSDVRAIGPLLAQAASAEPAIRQAAVEALGHFDDPRARALLRERLKDPVGLVRGKAAASLHRLNDASGLPLLEELAQAPEPEARLAAARYLASRPNASWLQLVRGLADSDSDEIRLGAAQLLIPHDPAAAEAMLSSLANGSQTLLPIREQAARSLAQAASNDLARLRALLRQSDRLARIAAADRLLQLTR